VIVLVLKAISVRSGRRSRSDPRRLRRKLYLLWSQRRSATCHRSGWRRRGRGDVSAGRHASCDENACTHYKKQHEENSNGSHGGPRIATLYIHCAGCFRISPCRDGYFQVLFSYPLMSGASRTGRPFHPGQTTYETGSMLRHQPAPRTKMNTPSGAQRRAGFPTVRVRGGAQKDYSPGHPEWYV
jgi:hypothetical protein